MQVTYGGMTVDYDKHPNDHATLPDCRPRYSKYGNDHATWVEQPYTDYRLPLVQLVAFKECTQCRDLLPATEDYFNRDPMRQLGLTSACRGCTKASRELWRSENLERAKEATRQSSYRRKIRKSGAGYERFGRLEIFERDGWVCGICGETVDKDLPFPDPMSASLDHVHPLAHGGAHSRNNTQCAHWLCNSRKGAQVCHLR